MKKARNKVSAKADINITPLIDVLLVLLVIFMTLSPTVPKALDTAIPQPARSDAPPSVNPPELIIVSVEQGGTIMINQREAVDENSLGPKLKELFASRPENVIFLTADPDLQFSEVARVIDIAKGRGGAQKIGLMTQRPASR